jgi:hypothetical protein
MYKAIKTLQEGQRITFNYVNKEYTLQIHSVDHQGNNDMNIQATSGVYKMAGMGMNVDKVTEKYLSLYDYTMFNVRTTMKILMSDISDVAVTEINTRPTTTTVKNVSQSFSTDMESIIESGIFGGGTTPSNLKTSKHTINN